MEIEKLEKHYWNDGGGAEEYVLASGRLRSVRGGHLHQDGRGQDGGLEVDKMVDWRRR
jgi:hypothetical protein